MYDNPVRGEPYIKNRGIFYSTKFINFQDPNTNKDFLYYMLMPNVYYMENNKYKIITRDFY